jgi:hypothetical protein
MVHNMREFAAAVTCASSGWLQVDGIHRRAVERNELQRTEKEGAGSMRDC